MHLLASGAIGPATRSEVSRNLLVHRAPAPSLAQASGLRFGLGMNRLRLRAPILYDQLQHQHQHQHLHFHQHFHQHLHHK